MNADVGRLERSSRAIEAVGVGAHGVGGELARGGSRLSRARLDGVPHHRLADATRPPLAVDPDALDLEPGAATMAQSTRRVLSCMQPTTRPSSTRHHELLVRDRRRSPRTPRDSRPRPHRRPAPGTGRASPRPAAARCRARRPPRRDGRPSSSVAQLGPQPGRVLRGPAHPGQHGLDAAVLWSMWSRKVHRLGTGEVGRRSAGRAGSRRRSAWPAAGRRPPPPAPSWRRSPRPRRPARRRPPTGPGRRPCRSGPCRRRSAPGPRPAASRSARRAATTESGRSTR